MSFDEAVAHANSEKSDGVLADRQVESQVVQILKTFNTWAYKRQQPTEPELLRAVINQKVRRQEAIEFLLYWGKGPRSAIADPDRQCLRFLAQMTERISNVYSPAASVLLIQTDTHATLNGHDREAIDRYFSDIEDAAGGHGFLCRRLSSIIQSAASRIDTKSEQLNAELRSKLEASAAKWYRGGDAIAIAAQRYYELNMIEKQAVQVACPGAIFITYNNSAFRNLFPQRLPVFYMYSVRKGVSVKPWFLDENGKPDALSDYNELSEAAVAHLRHVA